MSIFQPDILKDRVALITGGGSGIGRGIARAYLAHGARVCITSRKQESLDATARELHDETGGEVLAVAADVRNPEQIQAAVAAATDRFGKLDTLVNGAAGNFLSPAAALSEKGFRTVVEIDLFGTFHATKAAFEPLCAAGHGLVLNLSSTLHYRGTPLQVHASSAKAGIDAMSRTLAVEWGRFGIRVNVIAPGGIEDTEGIRRLAPGTLGAAFKAQIPLGRFGRIDEIAAMAVYLRSTAADWITGAIFVVDGGQAVSGMAMG